MSEKIMQIIGRKLPDVERLLGPLDASDIVNLSNTPCAERGCVKGYFGKGKYEIVFIDGVADWITIENIDSLTTDEFIDAWDLGSIKPDFKGTSGVLRHYNIYGMKELAVHRKDDGSVFIIHIRAFTD